MIRSHQTVAFFVLAYLLSWWPGLFMDASSGEAPILPLGPLAAAIAMLLFVGGWTTLKVFLQKVARWRVGWQWYLLVLVGPVAIAAAATAVSFGLGAEIKAGYAFPAAADLAAKFVFIFVLIGLGEEPAWRGFALPRLMAQHSALAASLMLWPLHLVWHWPLFGIEYHLWNMVPWAAALLGYTLIATWMFNRTEGSLLLPALFHAMVNTSAFVFSMFEGSDLTRMWWLFGAMWLAAGLVVLARAGAELGGEREGAGTALSQACHPARTPL
jgi:membrane protease YdiL (CAAX protease family)